MMVELGLEAPTTEKPEVGTMVEEEPELESTTQSGLQTQQQKGAQRPVLELEMKEPATQNLEEEQRPMSEAVQQFVVLTHYGTC